MLHTERKIWSQYLLTQENSNKWTIFAQFKGKCSNLVSLLVQIKHYKNKTSIKPVTFCLKKFGQGPVNCSKNAKTWAF